MLKLFSTIMVYLGVLFSGENLKSIALKGKKDAAINTNLFFQGFVKGFINQDLNEIKSCPLNNLDSTQLF